jgi:transcriptional regulator with XRE-family HTH domain
MGQWGGLARRVGRQIQRLRRRQGRSSEDVVASMRDTDAANFRKLEAGQRNATLSTLQEVADALGVPVAELFSDSDES